MSASDPSLWRRWFVAATVAEFIGFGVPAAVGAWTADQPLAVEATALVLAGAVEGAVLGYGQGLVIRRALPGLAARRWVAATAAGAAAAWALAMIGVALIQSAPTFVIVAAAPLLAAGLLLSIGTAQWWLLRPRVNRAWRWIAATAAGWLVALVAFTAVTTPLWQPGQDVVLIAAIGVLGGLVMAAVVAAVTGWALVRLVGRARAYRGPAEGPGPTVTFGPALGPAAPRS